MNTKRNVERYLSEENWVLESAGTVEKHLAGQHDQKRHAGGRGLAERMATGGTSNNAPAKTKTSKPKANKNKNNLQLGVDYDADGYPLDTDGGVVGEKLSEIHGLYDEASEEALAIAKRGMKKLLRPRDKDGLPQMLKLSDAEKRYGSTPAEVQSAIEKISGVKVEFRGGVGQSEHITDVLHGMAQAIEEAQMNGIKVSDYVGNITITNLSGGGDALGYFSYYDPLTGRPSITINGGSLPTGDRYKTSPLVDPNTTRIFNTQTPFESVGWKHSEAAVRSGYGVFIHELGHAIDHGVGKKIQETRKKVIDDVFRGTDLLVAGWETTERGRRILYQSREANATTYYGDIGAQGMVQTRRDGTIAIDERRQGFVDSSISFSTYASYNLRENFAETFTAYWLYGGSKGKYRKYYNGYIERVGNIIDMSQGVIKAVYPTIDNNRIVTRLSELPFDHPLMVWLTRIVPIA